MNIKINKQNIFKINLPIIQKWNIALKKIQEIFNLQKN